MDLSELVQERDWRRCRGPENATDAQLLEAFQFFCENFWHIKHPERGRILFKLREAQLDTVFDWISDLPITGSFSYYFA